MAARIRFSSACEVRNLHGKRGRFSMAQDSKFIYEFTERLVDGDGRMKDILGGKGAGLAEMCRAGLTVPPGFTISTKACNLFLQDPEAYSLTIWPRVMLAIHRLEQVCGRNFGVTPNPLLVSVRSGARFCMPGMMDTVLDKERS